jgi:hypothetical protein
MSHYAEIDSAGNVLRVIIADSQEWCESRLGGTWVQTSYTSSTRGNYAGIGYLYLAEHDLFVPPQPAYNYDLNTDTASWVFPDDNHLYIPAAPHIAERLSRALYSLVVPGGDGLFAGVIPHPQELGYPLLQFRSTDIVPIAIGAGPSALDEVLQITVDEAALTEQEKDDIVAAVSAMAGQSVEIVDFIPASWQPFVMTREQAEQAGYFESSI